MREIKLPAPTYGPPEHTLGTFEVHPDCRHYDGGLPCKYRRPCHNCPIYDPVGQRILIVLLEALGDILILSPLPGRLRKEYPKAHITWLVKERCAPLVQLNPDVDRILIYNWESVEQLRVEHFFLVLGLERVRAAASLVSQVSADHKKGLAISADDNALIALDEPSREILALDTWNDFRTKFNRGSWTELYFRVAGYTYAGEPYVAETSPEAQSAVHGWVTGRPAGKTICFNIGGSFSQKVWPDRHWADLAIALAQQNVNVLIMGGPAEAHRAMTLCEGVRAQVPGAWVKFFAASLEESCVIPAVVDAMVTNDSFGYHVGLLGGLPCVVLYGPSSPVEVTLPYAPNVVALRSTFACSPCAHQMSCGGIGGCMDTIEPEVVLEQVQRLLALTTSTD